MRSTSLLSLALLPTLLSASPIAVRNNKKGYSLREVGARNTEVNSDEHGRNHADVLLQEWRIWLEKDDNPISFWHDVPLYPDPKNKSIVHMVVEIQRWTSGKM